MFAERPPAVIGTAACFPVMAGERRDVERQVRTFSHSDYGRQTASQRITQFEKAVWPGTSDVGEDNAATMELGKDFLIDPRMVKGLPSVNNYQTVPEIVLKHRLRYHVEEILHARVIFVDGV